MITMARDAYSKYYPSGHNAAARKCNSNEKPHTIPGAGNCAKGLAACNIRTRSDCFPYARQDKRLVHGMLPSIAKGQQIRARFFKTLSAVHVRIKLRLNYVIVEVEREKYIEHTSASCIKRMSHNIVQREFHIGQWHVRMELLTVFGNASLLLSHQNSTIWFIAAGGSFRWYWFQG